MDPEIFWIQELCQGQEGPFSLGGGVYVCAHAHVHTRTSVSLYLKDNLRTAGRKNPHLTGRHSKEIKHLMPSSDQTGSEADVVSMITFKPLSHGSWSSWMPMEEESSFIQRKTKRIKASQKTSCQMCYMIPAVGQSWSCSPVDVWGEPKNFIQDVVWGQHQAEENTQTARLLTPGHLHLNLFRSKAGRSLNTSQVEIHTAKTKNLKTSFKHVLLCRCEKSSCLIRIRIRRLFYWSGWIRSYWSGCRCYLGKQSESG